MTFLVFMRQIFIVFIFLISFDSSFAQHWINTYEPGYFARWIIESYDQGDGILGTNISNYSYDWIIKQISMVQ